MESHWRSPCLHTDVRFGTQAWYHVDIPSYAKASEGYPPAAESAEAALKNP